MKTLILLLIVLSCIHSAKAPKVMEGITLERRAFNDLKGANNLLRKTKEATIAIWARPTVMTDHNQNLVSLSVGGKHEGWKSRASILFSPKGELLSAVRAQDNEERSELITKPGVIKMNEWQHIVLTINYAAKKMQFFYNGELVDTPVEKYLFTTPESADTPSNRSTLGAEDDGSGGYYSGELTQLRIERKILNANEIKKLMDETRP